MESILSHVEQGVMTITLNRPERLNSFNDVMHQQLSECLKQAERDDAIRCLLITGAGRGFCAGQDLNDRNVDPNGPAPDLGMSVETFYNPLVRRLAKLPKPVICAVNGVAAGAGATLALGCDMVIAARSASFVMAFSKLGLVPDCGGTWLLPRVAGRARAMGLALLGDKLSAEQAQAWGSIIMWVVIMVVFVYFFMIRPQKKEAKKKEQMMSELAVGDTVLTTSGFYGIVIDVSEDDTVIVEFGSNRNCRIPMQKAAIAAIEKPEEAVEAKETKEKK